MKSTSRQRANASIARLWEDGTRQLAGAGFPDAHNEALLLLAAALRKDRLAILCQPKIATDRQTRLRFKQMLTERLAYKPLAYITGYKAFWQSDFFVNEATLIPRPETELIVETVLDSFPSSENICVLDLGTGSGCILLSILQERFRWTGVGTDINSAAVAVAKINAERLGLGERTTFLTHNYQDNKKSLPHVVYDIVVSNPPYLIEEEITDLSPEVSNYEPHVALDGGAGGLDSLGVVIRFARGCVRQGGMIVLEHGPEQGLAVVDLLESNGFGSCRRRVDLAGRDRTVSAIKK